MHKVQTQTFYCTLTNKQTHSHTYTICGCCNYNNSLANMAKFNGFNFGIYHYIYPTNNGHNIKHTLQNNQPNKHARQLIVEDNHDDDIDNVMDKVDNVVVVVADVVKHNQDFRGFSIELKCF